MSSTRFDVRPGEAGLFLLDFLTARLGCSKRQAKALLDARVVFVNGRRVWMARHPLRAGDAVECAGECPAHSALARSSILFQNANYLICNKPAGILAVGPGSAEVVIRELTGEPGVQAAHRLDRDTSGCMLFARNERAMTALVELFRREELVKAYEVIALGRVPDNIREIDRPLERRSARTRVRILAANARATHLLVHIGTGRTHQIRKHLLAVGHPVLGDRAYGTSRALSAEARAVPRQMLHARALEFACPLEGCKIAAAAPVPPDFRDCLRRFGLADPRRAGEGDPVRLPRKALDRPRTAT